MRDLFRARGKYQGTGKDAYITTVWRATKESAEEDARLFNNRFTDVRVVKKEAKEFVDEINTNKRKRLPIWTY